MKKIYTILVLVIMFYSTLFALQDYDSSKRPSTEKTKVSIRYFIADLSNISNIEQSFTADFMLRLEWKDKRLINREGTYSLNEIWNPYIQVFNSKDIDNQLPEVVKVGKDGTVVYMQRFYGKFTNPLDFKKFPFDQQTLSIVFVSLLFSENEIDLNLDRGGEAEKLSISGWSIGASQVSFSPYKIEFDKGNQTKSSRASFICSMQGRREISYYWYKVLAPLCVIVLLSWAVFYIDPSQVGPQVGVSATSILTLIAFLLRLENIIPPISYLTRLDYFVFITLFLVFMAYLEAMISTSFALGGKKDLALKMDRLSRFIFPGLFITALILFWVI